MENFIVSARKYRPGTFQSVVGQDSITATLKNAIKNNQLAQAFLFTGPRGVGKTTCARILAKTINCKNLSDTIEPCNTCESCIAFNSSASFNFHELDAASNNSVDDIRSLVEQVRVPPQAAQYKIYIIDEVHMLSTQAFNAFLKTLEEPPAYAKFILATTEKHKIIPTILSRCQIFDFNRITVEAMAKHLTYVADNERITYEPEGLHMIAQKADGSLRDALSIFDQIATFSGNNITYEMVIENLNIVDVNTFFEVTDSILAQNIPSLLLQLNKIIDKGHDAHIFIMGLGEHMRNLLVSKDQSTVSLLETTKAIQAKYIEQAQACTLRFLIHAIDLINKSDVNYRNAGNKRLIIELCIIQICSLLNAQTNDTPETPKIITPVEKAAANPPQKEQSTRTLNTPDAPKKEAAPILTQQSVSLNPVQSKPYKEIEEKSEEKNIVEEHTIQDVDFSEDAFKNAWDSCLLNLTNENPGLKAILNFANPTKTKTNTIAINVSCELHKDDFIKNKPSIIQFLRQELNVKTIEFEINITKTDDIKLSKPFSAKDKYDKMVDKNASLDILRKGLDLEFEY